MSWIPVRAATRNPAHRYVGRTAADTEGVPASGAKEGSAWFKNYWDDVLRSSSLVVLNLEGADRPNNPQLIASPQQLKKAAGVYASEDASSLMHDTLLFFV